ncbi:hypothetical protein HZ326_28637, partial [Fusarium oxysporum f. sp. albedinis]
MVSFALLKRRSHSSD